jgi:hypothetical protein
VQVTRPLARGRLGGCPAPLQQSTLGPYTLTPRLAVRPQSISRSFRLSLNDLWFSCGYH